MPGRQCDDGSEGTSGRVPGDQDPVHPPKLRAVPESTGAISDMAGRDGKGKEGVPQCAVRRGYVVRGQAFTADEVTAALITLYRTTNDRPVFWDRVEEDFGKGMVTALYRIISRRDQRV